MKRTNLIPAQPKRTPRIAAVGMASWDHLIVVDRYPAAGEQANVRNEVYGPGGTTTNAAAAMAKLGAHVVIRALVGDDEPGNALRAALESAGVDTSSLTLVGGERTNRAIVIVSTNPPDRTMLWDQGICLSRGDRIDIATLFAHDVVYLDVNDVGLRRFLLDLPAHTLPATRLLGSLFYLALDPIEDAFDLVMRHDAIVGDASELMTITRTSNLDDAVAAVRARMRGENLRAAAITRGSSGSLAFTREQRWDAPAYRVPVVDTTGAGDVFAAAVAIGFACRWDWGVTIRFANAAAALSTSALGAQSAQPSFNETIDLMYTQPTDST
jgi:sugar/nucleoside kinase (ribokinase family)